jgi:hypothetical protein
MDGERQGGDRGPAQGHRLNDTVPIGGPDGKLYSPGEVAGEMAKACGRVGRGEPFIAKGTPVHEAHCGRRRVLVKREDLCCPFPGPCFAKIRGVMARMTKVIREAEKLFSFSAMTGHHSVTYYPKFKADGVQLRDAQRMAEIWGSELVPLAAGRSAILYHRARSRAREKNGIEYLFPNALKLEETVDETADEVERTPEVAKVANVVVPASSGTIAAGVLMGLERLGWEGTVWVHLGYSRSILAVEKYIIGMACREFDRSPITLKIVDEGYGYRDSSRARVAFPCSPYYGKARNWLEGCDDARGAFDGGCLFWNIGG